MKHQFRKDKNLKFCKQHKKFYLNLPCLEITKAGNGKKLLQEMEMSWIVLCISAAISLLILFDDQVKTLISET